MTTQGTYIPRGLPEFPASVPIALEDAPLAGRSRPYSLTQEARDVLNTYFREVPPPMDGLGQWCHGHNDIAIARCFCGGYFFLNRWEQHMEYCRAFSGEPLDFEAHVIFHMMNP